MNEDAKHYYCDEGTDEDPTPVHRCNQNATTNHPAPVILDDAALEEIEGQQVKRRESLAFHQSEYPGLPSPSYIEEIDALCATVRAAWAKYGAEEGDHRLTIDTFRQQERIWQQKFDEQDQANTALRERFDADHELLEKVVRERNDLRDQLAQSVFVDVLRRQVDANIELQSRLAQVEKERNELRADLELGEEP